MKGLHGYIKSISASIERGGRAWSRGWGGKETGVGKGDRGIFR